MADSTNTAYVEPHARPRQGIGASRASAPPRAAQPTPGVELANVAHRLGHRWALRGVTLQVEPGEVLAIVGPNGSGKTTLLRVVSTTLTPTRGGGRVFGRDLVDEADAVRALTGMLGHATGLYDDLSAVENLRFALRMCGETPSAPVIDRALEAVAMRQHASERVRALSSGMRRRLALARLILRRPRVLLLDEPYNSLDATGVVVVESLIRETADAGGVALVVTHDLGRASGVAFDRVVALDAGRVRGT